MAPRPKTRTRTVSTSDGGIITEGFGEFRRTLRRASADLPKRMREPQQRAAAMVAGEMLKRAPVGPPKRGHIRDTVKFGATQRQAWVKAGDARRPYIFPTEFGWPSRGIAPNAFVYPSIAARSQDIMRDFSSWIEDAFSLAFPIKI